MRRRSRAAPRWGASRSGPTPAADAVASASSARDRQRPWFTSVARQAGAGRGPGGRGMFRSAIPTGAAAFGDRPEQRGGGAGDERARDRPGASPRPWRRPRTRRARAPRPSASAESPHTDVILRHAREGFLKIGLLAAAVSARPLAAQADELLVGALRDQDGARRGGRGGHALDARTAASSRATAAPPTGPSRSRRRSRPAAVLVTARRRRAAARRRAAGRLAARRRSCGVTGRPT